MKCKHPAVDFIYFDLEDGSIYYCLECMQNFTLTQVHDLNLRIEHSVIYNREKEVSK